MGNYIYPSLSIIIRTLNEEKFLPECLKKIREQHHIGCVEIIVVDSGSTDNTINIAKGYGAKVIKISKSEFTFGRSLNLGCAVSSSDILVLLSAHCIPFDDDWLHNLVTPIIEGKSEYVYGKQIPREKVTKFSEGMVFKKYYPKHSSIPQDGYFCNNANSAILRATWERFHFNEKLTGLEDVDLAKRLLADGGSVSYVSSSIVEHIHEENWLRIKLRYEREAAALVEIEPSLKLNFRHALRLFLLSILIDFKFLDLRSSSNVIEIIFYRACQYYGSFKGGKVSKLRINRMDDEYFCPKLKDKVITLGEADDHNCTITNEST